MLQNEREVANTKIQLEKMEQALIEAQEKMAARPDLPAIVREGHLNGIRALIGDMKAELGEYESLRSGEVRAFPMQSVLAELPTALVRARIARGWTHRELAKALGTSEQQVQKDEAGGYAKASLDKLGRVAGVLGVSVSGRARLPRPPKVRSARSAKTPRRKAKS